MTSPQNAIQATPVRVAAQDRHTRRRAGATVARAYVGHPVWWLSVVVFFALAAVAAETAVDAYGVRGVLGVGWLLVLVATVVLSVALGLFFVPVAMGTAIYRATDLFFLDTGAGRAALATKPDRRRGAMPGDIQAHSFGAWPKRTHAGTILGEWVREDVHARGGRVTGTALPGLAQTYLRHGMVDDGRTARFLIRVASKPRS